MKESVKISTQIIQLNQLLKWMGLLETGGQITYILNDGKIILNGEKVYEKRKKIRPGDTLSINGREYYIVLDDVLSNEY